MSDFALSVEIPSLVSLKVGPPASLFLIMFSSRALSTQNALFH